MKRSPLAIAFDEVRRQRGDLVASVALHLGEKLALLGLPIIATELVAEVNARGRLPAAEVALVVGVLVSLAVFRNLGAYFGIRAQERSVRALRGEVLRMGILLPLSKTHERRSGELATMLGSQCERLAHFAADLSRDVVPTAVTLLGGLVLIARIDVDLMLAVLPTIVLAVVGIRLLARRARPAMARAAEAEARLDGFVKESFGLLAALRIHGAETRRLAEHDEALDELYQARMAQQRSLSWVGGLSLLLGTLSLLALLLLGAHKLGAGELSGLDLVAAVLLAFVLVSPLAAIADYYGRYGGAQVVDRQLVSLLGGELEEQEAGAELPDGPGAIEVRDLAFTYPGRGELLAGLSFDVRAGATTAIVGANGAGKTTLIRLLLRLLEPERGAIRVDGADIATLSLRSLRAAVAVVTQEDFIAYGTIRDAIDFGGDALTDEQVAAAAEEVGIDAYVSGLELGYRTPVASRGATLSGGQRKCLQIARALARTPRILVLDEPTAMLDRRAHGLVLDAVRRVTGARTVLIATHDDKLVELADHVVELA